MNKDTIYLRFKTADGNLIMDRKSMKRHYFLLSGAPDHEFIEYSLGADARQKGVKIVSKNITQEGIECVVQWL